MGAQSTITSRGRSSRFQSVIKDIYSRPSGAIGLTLVLFHLVLAIVGPIIAPFDYKALDPNLMLRGPTSLHWFGTDHLGRDIFSRTLLGGREAIFGYRDSNTACGTVGRIRRYLFRPCGRAGG